MKGRLGMGRRPSPAIFVAAVALVFASVGMVVGANLQLPKFFTPNSENQISNIDVLRANIKSYYGDTGASTGNPSTNPGWTHTLNASSAYAAEAKSVTSSAWDYLKTKVGKYSNPAIVFDVDDTTLTTWNYELFSNWDYNPTTNAVFVGTDGTNCPNACTFTGNMFPATPGMLDLLTNASEAGYSIFFITGRGDAQHMITIANLESDAAAGFTNLTTVTYGGQTVPEFDVNYPAPEPLDSGHGTAMNGGYTFADGLFTKPAVGDYPSYLTSTGFCTGTASCPTISYKSGTRAYIQSSGYHIVANFGDQFSDLLGGYSDTTWKMPNPNYYLP